MSKEQELNLDKNRKKFDIREEYFVAFGFSPSFNGILIQSLQRLSAVADEDWEPKRIQRPKGLPDWGVPPTEHPSKGP
jgi:cytochrome c oxidase assembly protein subunit 16